MATPEMISGLFDKYSIRARLYPAFIAALPMLTIAVLILPSHLPAALIGLGVSSGAFFLLASMTRTGGRTIERKLVVRWEGLPTTHMLRHREVTNGTLFLRRRQALEGALGVSLPTAELELANPQAADEEYSAATRQLIFLVQQQQDRFPRVFDENVNYGFIRNMLGLKPIGLTLLGTSFMANYFTTGWFPSASAIALSLVLDVVLAGVWLLYVRPSRVFDAGQIYADRLFECLTGLDRPLKQPPHHNAAAES